MAILGRSRPIRPHLARPISAAQTALPVIASRTQTSALEHRSYERRGAPRPHLAVGVAASTSGGAAVVPGITKHQAPRQESRRPSPRAHYARPLLFKGGVPFAPGVFVNIIPSERFTTYRRGAPKPHLISGAVVVQQVGGVNPLPSNVRSGLLPRGSYKVPLVRVPRALIVYGTAVVPGRTSLLQALARALVGRTIFHPHLSPAQTASGTAVIPNATVTLSTLSKRSTSLRGAPHSHLVGPALNQPPAVSPLPPTILHSQALQRPLRNRTVPRPHLSPANLHASPFRPAVFHTQLLRRVHIGRTTPHPHVPAAVVTPLPPFVQPAAPGTFHYQPIPRALIGRKLSPLHLAPPLVTPVVPKPLYVITVAATVSGYRWTVNVGNPRWSTQQSPARWAASIPPTSRWKAKVTRFA